MNDKDSKLIWENFNEGRQPGEEEIPGHDDDDPVYDEVRDDDPWGETDGERQTREKYTPEHSLEVLQGLLPKLNEDQFKYLQKALYDAVAGVNDMIEAGEGRKQELTDFAYDGDGDDWVAGLFDKDGDEIDDDNEDPRDRLNWS